MPLVVSGVTLKKRFLTQELINGTNHLVSDRNSAIKLSIDLMKEQKKVALDRSARHEILRPLIIDNKDLGKLRSFDFRSTRLDSEDMDIILYVENSRTRQKVLNTQIHGLNIKTRDFINPPKSEQKSILTEFNDRFFTKVGKSNLEIENDQVKVSLAIYKLCRLPKSKDNILNFKLQGAG